ncbi:MAG: AbrB family transcriptional regulator [Candidatus Micrarchaeota archaeon]|nr:AbrB family transcriptional regulator [Candidatus Micrarchaeota archaeon]
MDDQGRIYLPKKVKEGMGRRFFAFKMRGELILVPIPEDPVKDLQEQGKKLPKNISIKTLRKEAYEEAMKEAMSNVERLEKLKKSKGL